MDGEDNLPPEAVVEESALAPVEHTEETSQSLSVEDLASEMGWTPQDKWRGDPEKWKPADEFMRRTVDVNRSLKNQMERLESTVSNMARTSAQLTEQAVARERQKLLNERREAIEMADYEGVREIEVKLESLPTPTPVMPPETQAFIERNPWFNKDQEATAWATNRAEELSKQGLGAARQLAIVEREAKQLFPEFFDEPARAKPAPLNKPGTRGAPPQQKSFATLPEDVKSAALDYEKRGYCTKEEYAKIYYEQGVGA